ncbi:MAG: NAD(+)/NADH kinase [Nitrososphaerales archaeon]
MQILVIPRRRIGPVIREVSETLQKLGFTHQVAEAPTVENIKAYDMILVVGGDGDVLRVFQKLGSESIPVLGVSEADGESFLTEVGISNFKQSLQDIASSNYQIEEATRLEVLVDDRNLPPVLNEVAIFPTRSASFIEYLLKVDGETIWRDYGDGLILATPTGSTAYAMSAGGPMVHQKAAVFILVPVNSVDVTRRPLVVNDSSTIEISEINSRYDCEVVLDGIVRVKAENTVKAKKASTPAKIVRLIGASATQNKIKRKVKLAEELLKMPPSAKLVLKTLEYEGPLGQREISEKTLLPPRTTRLALRLLLSKGLIKRSQDLRDARHRLYRIA